MVDLLDEDGEVLCARATWERAANFLLNLARRLWSNQAVRIDAPSILAGPDGSVDIHWERPHYEMLVNIPSDDRSPITYYGDDRDGNTVKGRLTSWNNPGILLWLATATNKEVGPTRAFPTLTQSTCESTELR